MARAREGLVLNTRRFVIARDVLALLGAVSVCRALGADVIIAVNLNGDLLGRRFAGEPLADTALPSQIPNEFLAGVVKQLPPVLRAQATQIVQRLLPQWPAAPGYFQVLANSINIMQDYVTRARLAGEPPHVMLAPRLRDIGLMEYNRAAEAIAEGRYCVEQAIPMLGTTVADANVCLRVSCAALLQNRYGR